MRLLLTCLCTAILLLPSLIKAQENPLQIVLLFGQSNASRPGLDSSMQYRADQLGENVYVHKVAEGGLSLAQVDGARDWSPSSTNEAYDDFIANVHSTMHSLRTNGLKPVITAGFWVQGEGDALILGRAVEYESNLANFANSLWRDLGAFPLWISELSNQQNPFASVVQAAQIAQDLSLENLHLLTTEDLTFLPDGVHYTREAQHLLGRRIIDALIDKEHIKANDGFKNIKLNATSHIISWVDFYNPSGLLKRRELQLQNGKLVDYYFDNGYLVKSHIFDYPDMHIWFSRISTFPYGAFKQQVFQWD